MSHKTGSPSCGNIVVVNDSATQRAILTGILKERGLNVQAYPNAEEALTAMDRGNPPGLIITDLNMPGIDGWRFCRLLRAPEFEAFNSIPILVVSATFSGEDPGEITVAVGADAFMALPVESASLLEQVRILLAGDAPRTATGVLIVDDSKTVAFMLRDAFEAHGYFPRVALTGAEGIDLFQKHLPEIVILDYHLSDIAGDQLLDTFRELYPSSVLVMMTGDSRPDLALDWMRRGASAYVRKPLDPEYVITLCENAHREQSLLRIETLLEIRTREWRESEEKHQRLVNSLTGSFLYRHDVDGVFTYISPSITSVLGYTQEEFLKHFSEYMTENPKNRDVHKHTALSIRGIQQPPYEVELIAKDGSLRWLEVSEVPVCDADERVVAVEGVAHDISKRKRAEVALRESEEKARSILNASPSAIVLLNKDGIVLDCNNAYPARFGMTRDTLVGTCVWGLFPEETMKHRKAQVENVFETGNPILGEDERQGLWNEYHIEVATKNVSGEVTAVIVEALDITDRKQAEREIQESKQRSETILQSIQNGVLVIDAETVIRLLKRIRRLWL